MLRSLQLLHERRDLLALVVALEDGAGIKPVSVRQSPAKDDVFVYYRGCYAVPVLALFKNKTRANELLGEHNHALAFEVDNPGYDARAVSDSLSKSLGRKFDPVNGKDFGIPEQIWMVQSVGGHTIQFLPRDMPLPPSEPWSPVWLDRFERELDT